MDFSEKRLLLGRLGVPVTLAYEYRNTPSGGREPVDLEIFTKFEPPFAAESSPSGTRSRS